MKIPIPCRFGERAECNGSGLLLFNGVDWFNWNEGMEYTYFFDTGNKWHPVEFYVTMKSQQPHEVEIDDSLLVDTYLKEKGYPLRGTGYVTGLRWQNNKRYIDFILTSHYLTHIKVQCDEKGMYVPGGDIIYPPSWDTKEKKEKILLKSAKIEREQELMEAVQMNIFDFLGKK